MDEDDDDAEEEVASDGCHEPGSRALPLGGGVGSVMTLVLWVDHCGGLRLREKKKPGGYGGAAVTRLPCHVLADWAAAPLKVEATATSSKSEQRAAEPFL